mgnify:CR=1 FL=1
MARAVAWHMLNGVHPSRIVVLTGYAAQVVLIRQELAPLPYPVIANDIKGAKASAELIGEALAASRHRDDLRSARGRLPHHPPSSPGCPPPPR